jgi:O-antigen/teichoic acid export membrane protein
MLLAGFLHLGWIETFVRFGARLHGDPLFGWLRGRLLRRTLISAAALGALAAALSPWISEAVYHRAGFGAYLQLAALGAFGLTWFSFTQSDSRARQRFGEFTAVQTGSSALRLALLALCALGGWLSLETAASTYVLVPFVFALAAPLWTPRLPAAEGDEASRRTVLGEISGYHRWLLASLFCTNVIGNIDAHFLAHYHSNRVLAAFGAAARLTLPVQFMVTAMTTTLLPKLSAVRELDQVRFYLRKLALFLVPLGVGLLVLCWIAPPALIWIAGESYREIGPLLRWQILATTVVLLVNPVGIVLYAWGLSSRFALLNAVQLVIDLALNLWWIPRYGAVGAVASTLVVNLIGMIVVYGSVIALLRRGPGAKTGVGSST